MHYKNIMSHFTGISCPIFGVSWNPSIPEINIAKKIIVFLEDRRVLFNPYYLEVFEQCIDSVLEIRKFLTNILIELINSKELKEHVEAMRAACRKFLDKTNDKHGAIHHNIYFPGRNNGENFFIVLGDFRTELGFRIGLIAMMFGLDLNDELSSILPTNIDEQLDEVIPSKKTKKSKK